MTSPQEDASALAAELYELGMLQGRPSAEFLAIFSGTRAFAEIRLTLSYSDILDSLAEALPRWLPRRALARRAAGIRAQARWSFVEVAAIFLED